MRAMMLSCSPIECMNLLNGDLSLLVRRFSPNCKLPIDVYVYCTKGNKKDWHLIEVVDTDTGWEGYEYDYYIGSKDYLDWCLECKVVAKFTLNKVEEIKFSVYDKFYYTKTIDTLICSGQREPLLLKKSCLNIDDFDNYLHCGKGYAWYIDNLEIFARPKELGEFRLHNDYKKCKSKNCSYDGGCWLCELTKAPITYCYVEV